MRLRAQKSLKKNPFINHKTNLMVDYFQVFNNKVLEFLDDVKNIHPDTQKFTVYENILRTTIQFNNKLPLQLFHTNVYVPYGTYIEKKDEAFLLNTDYEGTQNDELVKMIKSIWTTLSDNNKEAIWNYLRVFIAIDKRTFA